MAHKGRKRGVTKMGHKTGVGRHRTMSARDADVLERAIEKVERRDARREIEEQLEERSRAEQGTWNAIDSWWGA